MKEKDVNKTKAQEDKHEIEKQKKEEWLKKEKIKLVEQKKRVYELS